MAIHGTHHPGVAAGDAARRWAADLATWAIPAEILDAAPESPWGCPTGLFARSAEEAAASGAAASPSARRALDVLPEGGTVLDVGVGGGAASLPLAPPAARVVGVDESPKMLTAFVALAERLGVAHAEVEGSWPEAAAFVGPADVALCHHVLYNVADLTAFVAALTSRARRRVVVELTATHPQSSLNELWRRFHKLERPTRPTAEDALEVLAGLGLEVGVERWEAPGRWEGAPRDELVAFVRRRLCLPAAREPEVAAAIDEVFQPGPRRLVTCWWPGSAS